MAYEAGEAYLQIVPSFRGLVTAIEREAERSARAFAATFNRETERAIRPINVRLDTLAARAELLRLRAEIARLRDERPEVQVDTDRARRSVSALGLAVALLGPAAIAAGAVLGGALVGLVPAAGTAALAIFGVRDAWKSGALAGTSFATQVSAAHEQLTLLKQTAAAGVLPGLDTALRALHPLLGPLNNEVRVFSGQLGQIAAALAPALAHALIGLQPLFTMLGNVLATGANKLAAWVQNGQGIQHFSDFVAANLPNVLQVLGQLAELAFHLAEAFAPIGQVVLSGLGIIADVLNAIPVNVLTGLAAAAITAYVAFQVFKTIATIVLFVREAMLLLRASSLLMAGSIIGIIAILAAFAIGMSSGGDNTADAKEAMDSYSASVRDGTNALSEGRLAQTAKALADKDALSTLDQLHASNQLLGVSYRDLVTAVNGSDAQFNALATRLRVLSLRMDGTGEAARALLATLEAQRAGLGATIDKTGALGSVFDQLSPKLSANAAALGVTAQAYQDAAEAAKKNTDQANAQTLAFQLENDAASLLDQALKGLAGISLSMAQAQTTLRSANLRVGKSFKDNGTAIRGGSEAAVANQTAIQGQVSAARAAAKVIAEKTNSEVKGRQSLLASRDALEAQLRSQGKLTPAVQAYIEKLYNVKGISDYLTAHPTDIDARTEKAKGNISELQRLIRDIQQGRVPNIDANTGPGRARIEKLQRQIDRLHGKEVLIGIHLRANQAANVRNEIANINKAHGGIVDFYAAGGVRRENHIAQIAPALSTFRVWAEPETGGEAYIPLAAAKRARSREIALETVRRLGGVARFTDGGLSVADRAARDFTLAPATAAAAPVITQHITQQPREDGAALAERVSARITFNMRARG